MGRLPQYNEAKGVVEQKRGAKIGQKKKNETDSCRVG